MLHVMNNSRFSLYCCYCLGFNGFEVIADGNCYFHHAWCPYVIGSIFILHPIHPERRQIISVLQTCWRVLLSEFSDEALQKSLHKIREHRQHAEPCRTNTEAGWDKVPSQASPRIMSAMQHKIRLVHVV